MTMRMRIGAWRLVMATVVAFAVFAWISPPARAQVAPAAARVAESAPIPAAQIPEDDH